MHTPMKISKKELAAASEEALIKRGSSLKMPGQSSSAAISSKDQM
jgi:hypothetical protein